MTLLYRLSLLELAVFMLEPLTAGVMVGTGWRLNSVGEFLLRQHKALGLVLSLGGGGVRCVEAGRGKSRQWRLCGRGELGQVSFLRFL